MILRRLLAGGGHDAHCGCLMQQEGRARWPSRQAEDTGLDVTEDSSGQSKRGHGGV